MTSSSDAFHSKEDDIPRLVFGTRLVSCNRDLASISILDPRPVSGTRRICGTRLLPEVLRYAVIDKRTIAFGSGLCVTAAAAAAADDDGGAVPVSVGSSEAAAPDAGGAAADVRDGDGNGGRSTTVAVNEQVVLQEQMELAIKSSLSQPMRNCMNDKSMIAVIKSEMAVFECSGVRGRILQLVYAYLRSIPPHL